MRLKQNFYGQYVWKPKILGERGHFHNWAVLRVSKTCERKTETDQTTYIKNIFRLFWHWQRCFVRESRLNEQSQPSSGHHCQIIESDKTLAIFGLSTTLRSQNFNSCQLLFKMLLENRSGGYFSGTFAIFFASIVAHCFLARTISTSWE